MEQSSTFIPITTTYAAIFALIMTALGIWVSAGRAKTNIMFGDGGDPEMMKRTRVFGNFVEYVPMAVIIMFVIENASGRSIVLHVLGVALLVGRLLHATGINPEKPLTIGRGLGAALTYLVLGLGALYALKLVLPGI